MQFFLHPSFNYTHVSKHFIHKLCTTINKLSTAFPTSPVKPDNSLSPTPAVPSNHQTSVPSHHIPRHSKKNPPAKRGGHPEKKQPAQPLTQLHFNIYALNFSKKLTQKNRSLLVNGKNRLALRTTEPAASGSLESF